MYLFDSSVMRILPRDMRPHVRLEDVVILHKSMSDLMPGQAVLQFIEVLKSWPLFGASIFEISVSDHITFYIPGPSCSKLTMSLVNVLLKL